jgi:hypothetical protein
MNQNHRPVTAGDSAIYLLVDGDWVPEGGYVKNATGEWVYRLRGDEPLPTKKTKK